MDNLPQNAKPDLIGTRIQDEFDFSEFINF